MSTAWLIARADDLVPEWWRDLYRPFELHARASEWHPDRIDSDHARPRWPERLDAWTRAIALCERIGAA